MNTAPTTAEWLLIVKHDHVEYREGLFYRDDELVIDAKALRELILQGLVGKSGSLLKLTTAGEVELAR